MAFTLYLNHFVEMCDAIIEGLYRKPVVIDLPSCLQEVLDLAGEEEHAP